MPDLEERLAYWQKVLRLQDWTVYLERCRAKEIQGNWGYSERNWEAHVARIRIVHDDDIGSTWEALPGWNPEQVLLHELMHCHLHHWDDQEPLAKASRELACNQLADAFLALEHRDA